MLRQFGKRKLESSEVFDFAFIEKLSNLFISQEMNEKLLTEILNDIKTNFNADEAAIFILKNDSLICKIAVGTTSLVENRKISTKIGLGGWIMESHKPAFLPEVEKDIRFDKSDNIFSPIPATIVASPILFNGHIYGIIQLNRRERNKPFNKTDAKHLFETSNIIGLFFSYLFLKHKQEKIKEQKKTEKQQGEVSFSSVAQSIPIGFFVLDKNLRILSVNNFALTTLGLQKENVIGKNSSEVILSDDKKGNEPILNDFFSTFPEKNYFQSPLHLKRTDGHEITTAFGISPFTFEGENFAILYFTNPAEWEMVYSKEDEFITNVAHELRTPLFAIIGSLSILENELKRMNNLPPTISNFLNIIRDEGEKFSSILNALLDFDEVSKWNIGLKREAIPILGFLRKIAENFEQKAKETNVSIEVNFPEEEVHISGDKLAIQYAFSHLIDNAIKFNKPGGKVIVSTEGLVLRDSSWNFEIVIKDTGIGIPKGEIPYVFGKFYRVEKKVHTISGFGLGLTIVKDIIDMHGGDIAIESDIDKGTTVTIQLPATEI